MSVFVFKIMFSCFGRSLCDELIIRPKKPYHVSDNAQKSKKRASNNVDRRSTPKKGNLLQGASPNVVDGNYEEE
jgi:hypothetical protein